MKAKRKQQAVVAISENSISVQTRQQARSERQKASPIR